MNFGYFVCVFVLGLGEFCVDLGNFECKFFKKEEVDFESGVMVFFILINNCVEVVC